MSRYGDPQAAAIDRLRAEAEVTGQVIEDLSRALEDSEAMCDRYREALVDVREIATEGIQTAPSGHRAKYIRIRDRIDKAIWTRRSDAA